MDKQIKVKFDIKTGKPTIETSGYSGKECTDASKFIEEALGEASETSYKPEFYEYDEGTQHKTNYQSE